MKNEEGEENEPTLQSMGSTEPRSCMESQLQPKEQVTYADVQSHKPIGRKRILEESPKFMKKMRKL
jgi:hypothetical protein